ncbi:UPF0728 protein C10orf53 homolog [Pterocles gutturalis]
MTKQQQKLAARCFLNQTFSVVKNKLKIKMLQTAVTAVLQSDGHQVILEEIPDWNAVELVVNGETVFRCNINDLDFGGDGKLDPLCEEARKAVLNAY